MDIAVKIEKLILGILGAVIIIAMIPGLLPSLITSLRNLTGVTGFVFSSMFAANGAMDYLLGGAVIIIIIILLTNLFKLGGKKR